MRLRDINEELEAVVGELSESGKESYWGRRAGDSKTVKMKPVMGRELDEADLSGARAYVRKIRNKGKKEYANAYLKWLSGGKKGEEPDYHDYGLSVMGKQAVHMRLEDFGFSYVEESVGLGDYDEACTTPGMKKRSMGKGRGLARGKGKGPMGSPVGTNSRLRRPGRGLGRGMGRGSELEFSESKGRFKTGDKVRITLKGMQWHSRQTPAHAGYTREQMSYRKKLSALRAKDAVGTVERVFPSGGMNVDFDGQLFDIKPQMVELVSNESFEMGETRGWEQKGSSWMLSGPEAVMVIKEKPGPGIPIYVLYAMIGSKTFRLRGQKKKLSDMKKVGRQWFSSFHDPAASVIMTNWSRVTGGI